MATKPKPVVVNPVAAGAAGTPVGTPVGTPEIDLKGLLDTLGIAPEDLAKGLANLVGGPETITGSIGKSKSAPKKKAASKKAASSTTTSPTEAQLQQQLADSPWAQLAQSLVGEQQAIMPSINSALSGADTAPAESQAANTALGALGLSPKSSAADWLSDQVKAANAADAPMMQAMQAYQNAYDSGQSGIDKALIGVGQANQAFVQSSPEAAWLQMIQEHIGSNINYYGYAPTSALQSLPPAVQVALAESGPGGTEVGAEPVSDIKLPGAVLKALGFEPSSSTYQQLSGKTNTNLSGLPGSDTGTTPGLTAPQANSVAQPG